MLSYKTRITGASTVQPKLKIGQPGDKYEQEADAVADRVMMITDSNMMQMQPIEEEEEMIQPKLRMQPIEEEEEEMLQPTLRMQPIKEEYSMCPDCLRKPMVQNQPGEVGEIVHVKEIQGRARQAGTEVEQRINSMKGRGQPLDPITRGFFEPRFGKDFNNVRVHSGGKASDVSRSINARAFTLGNDVVFGAGEYQPGSREGKRLLGHELAHVVQQGNLNNTNRLSSKLNKKAKVKSLSFSEAKGRIFRNYLGSAAEVSSGVSETISNAPTAYAAWNGTYSWTSRFGLFLNAVTRTVTVIMKLYTTASDAVKTAWKNAIESKWGNRFSLRVRHPGSTNGICYPILVNIQWQSRPSGAHYTITPNSPTATAGGRSGIGGTTSMTGWGTADTVDITHEFGHMLGNTDEYFTTNGVDYTFGGTRTGFRDPTGSIMNNPSNNPTALHYELIRLNTAPLMGVNETLCQVVPFCVQPSTGSDPGDYSLPQNTDVAYA